jgi:resuscitation-promoting factor RpfA
MGLGQRGMNTPYPQQAPGPNVPVNPADPAAPPPPAPDAAPVLPPA